LRYVRYTVCTCRYVTVCQIHCLYLPVYCGISETLYEPVGTLQYVRYTVCTCRYFAVCQIHSMYLPVCCFMSDSLCVCPNLPVCCGMSEPHFVCPNLPVCYVLSDTVSVPAGMLLYVRYNVCTCRYVAVCQINCLYLQVCCGISDTL